MRYTLESIFKVGFGVELKCMDGFTREGEEFMEAFDEGNVATSLRYIDPLWKLTRFLNIGSQSRLKKSIATIDKFVYSLITTKRKEFAKEQEAKEQETVSSLKFILFGIVFTVLNLSKNVLLVSLGC